MNRTFRAPHPDRVVVLPRHLSPSGANLRLAQNETITLDASRVDRFIRKSLENGDLEEVTETAGATAGEKGKIK